MTSCDFALPTIDRLSADNFSAAGDAPALVLPAAVMPPVGVQAVLIGVDAEARLPSTHRDRFDVLVTTAPDAPAPWISVEAKLFDAHVRALVDAVNDSPVAATMLMQVLRMNEVLPFDQAIMIESMAYSSLLGGAEFRRWLDSVKQAQAGNTSPADPVLMDRIDNAVTLTLNDPVNRNAMTAEMRDGLFAALANLIDDPSNPTLTLSGAGSCFSTGGHIPEFGSATDLAAAHIHRTLHSNALALHDLGQRATVRFHGAAIGSGLEVGAAAHHRIAAPDSWFQLPELGMGLIPGAGGTVTLPRVIGRHRTAWMVLTGKRLTARHALAMGLIHQIVAV